MTEPKPEPGGASAGQPARQPSEGVAAAPGHLRALIAERQDVRRYQDLLWTGTFWDYLAMVEANPRLCRNAFQYCAPRETGSAPAAGSRSS